MGIIRYNKLLETSFDLGIKGEGPIKDVRPI